jgi:hypothetical protein
MSFNIIIIIILIEVYSIDFCHKSKEQRLRITKMQATLQKY